MSVKLISVPKRVTKGEETANIRKVSNGYKVSNLARTTLGINPNSRACLAIGMDEITNKLVVKSVPETAEYNAVMNKNRTITNTGISKYLESIGNRFSISKETNSEGYHFMTLDNEINDTTSATEGTNESNNITESNTYNMDEVSPRDAEIQADDEDVTFS